MLFVSFNIAYFPVSLSNQHWSKIDDYDIDYAYDIIYVMGSSECDHSSFSGINKSCIKEYIIPNKHTMYHNNVLFSSALHSWLIIVV